MLNARLEDSQPGIKIARRNINNLRYADDTILIAESKEPLDEGREESRKAGLKLNIQKTKIMASGLITSWQIDGEKMETVTDFIFLGSKITVDGDCSHEIKTVATWKESYDKLRQCQGMPRWHHWLNGHEFEQTPGDSEEQGGLVCCSSRGHKESDTT